MARRMTYVGSGSGASTFDAIGSGTNTTATMTVGTGATLNTSGSGTIAASTSTTATNATNVATTAVTSNAEFYPLIVAATANSNQAASLVTGLHVNPSTGVATFPGDVVVGSGTPYFGGTPGVAAVTAASTAAVQFSSTGNRLVQGYNGGTNSVLLDAGLANTMLAGATLDASAITSVAGFKVPVVAGYIPVANGALGFDSTINAHVGGGAGGVTGIYPRLLATLACDGTASVDGVCVSYGTGFTTGTTLTNCAAPSATPAKCTNISTNETAFGWSYSIPANYFQANRSLRVEIFDDETAPGSGSTVTLKVKLGSTAIYTNNAAAPAARTNQGNGVVLHLQATTAPGSSANLVVSQYAGLGSWTGAGVSALPQAFATNGAITLSSTIQYGSASDTTVVYRIRQVRILGE